MQKLPPQDLSSIRQIIVHEDHPSVATPASYGQGLIPFCRKNPKISIERRVDVWRTEFAGAGYTKRSTTFVIQDIMVWVHETALLSSKGMPSGSFKLVLHGPTPQASQQLHDAVVQCEIVQEAALEAAQREGKQHPFQWHGVSRNFPEVAKDILRAICPYASRQK
jgi:hypothetical protein